MELRAAVGGVVALACACKPELQAVFHRPAPAAEGTQLEPDAPAPEPKTPEHAFFVIVEGTIELSPQAKAVAPELVRALGDIAITTASESITGQGRQAVSYHLSTGDAMDTRAFEQRVGGLDAMWDAHHVDLTGSGENWRVAWHELWSSCGPPASESAEFEVLDPVFMRARRILEDRVETVSFGFAMGPGSEALVGWAQREGVLLFTGLAEVPSFPSATPDWLRFVTDLRPDGVGFGCRRSIH